MSAEAGAAVSGGFAAVPVRDVLTLACWGAAGLAVAVRRFRWDPIPVRAGGTGPADTGHDEREAVGR